MSKFKSGKNYFAIKVSDKNFNKAVPIPLTNKQVRMITTVKNGDENKDPLTDYFWGAFIKNAEKRGIKLDLMKPDPDARFMVTVSTYLMIREAVEKWALKRKTYLKRGTKAFNNAVGMHMLNYSPTEIEHPDAKDNVVYYLKDMEGTLSE